jgi:peptidyl-prolyl cis-trans isomerase A (cyclophilin A)
MKRLLFGVVALASLALVVSAQEGDRKADKKAGDGKNPIVVMDTSMGVVKIELDAQHAPNTVKNFLAYVDDKFYDGTIFHRVIKDFMIQGGGFEKGLKDVKTAAEFKSKQKKTRDPIKNEAPNGLSNVRGTIAMARTNDLDSATAQFFINVKDNRGLDNRESPYCVFGKVIDGMDVVDKIRDVRTTGRGGRPLPDMPVEEVVIKSVRRQEKK